MDFLIVIMTVCSVSNPASCEDKRVQFAWNGNPVECGRAQISIAQWIAEHPAWTVRGWRCDDSDKRKQDI